ncbi:MAG: glycosyltransferase [Bacteroidetes bacterium]|jgi:glycosyltransferase involved in cell wall biosynthesis|nr:glycosyltransferase [Bacteroidota bacterium]
MAEDAAPSRSLVLVGPAYPYRGGIAHFTMAMARALRQDGHDAAIVTFTRQYPALLFPGKTQFETAPPADPVPTVRRIDSLNPLSWLRAAREMVAQQPEAVIFHHWMPFFAPAYAVMTWWLRRHGIPVLAVVHNALPHERRPGDRVLSRLFFRQLDGAIALSDAVERDLQTLGMRAPVVRCEHPVYDQFGEPLPRAEARASLGLDAEVPVLLFFGLVRPYKGLHVLLDALPQVAQRLPGVQLLVAGEFYDDETAYRAQVQRLGIAEHVRLYPEYVPQDEVPRYFSATDVVVQPYVSATQSGVAKVAFQFDRPVITTDVGGLAETVPHGTAGLVVPPENPGALAAAIVQFFEEEMGERLTAGVRRIKRQHGWAPLVAATEQLLGHVRSDVRTP